ncbi:Calcium-dependent lipid-binding (CaLB domain) family protein [Rhynchospora pubera]|uniref:Calcium-dependent lipid-binding (CaLB domain) family protein n=1 Tax=Rhynchospora pubera TaxID=906938 RepID=A0AAV8HSQ8_9POAL|nr:Calcium-dependent lipid-binding (CaLB domain) family protein [Rhynchospora pubera]
MEIKSLEVTIISAKDLKKIKWFSKMSVYAIATISGADPADVRRTVPDREGGRSPNWGTVVRFVIRSLDPHLALHIVLRAEGFLRDREVGAVSIPVKDLLESGASGVEQLVSYQVCRSSGRPKGVLNLSYKVIEPFGSPSPSMPAISIHSQSPVQHHVKGEVPVTVYPVVHPYPPPSRPYPGGTPYGAPPSYPSYPNAYPYPIAAPAYGYGAPMPHQGYGYGPAPAQPKKKSRFGAGLGMGLLGGALGGMMLGDMVADSAAYDAGYDAGFDAGDGF